MFDGHPDAVRGRPDLRVFSMAKNISVPRSVVLESGFVMSALEARAPHHDAVAVFFERMIEAQTDLFYNSLLELELHELAFEHAVHEIRGRDLHLVVTYRDPRARNLARGLLERWHAVLARASTVHVDVPDLLTDVPYFMERFGLSAAHAVQASLAVASGAAGIATVDPRYGAVDASLVGLYVPEPLVRSAQSRRPGRP